jgi:hypothetical protein
MQAIEPLEYRRIYHIYDRGVGDADLFTCKEEYGHFLRLDGKYADTYAWVLLKNHFHLPVSIREEEDIPFFDELSSEYFSNSSISPDLSASPTCQRRINKPHRETVLGCFDGEANFKVYHRQTLNRHI